MGRLVGFILWKCKVQYSLRNPNPLYSEMLISVQDRVDFFTDLL